MKNKILFGIVALGMTIVLFQSCNTLPQQEINAANAAIEEAKTAGADVYMQNDFLALQDSMKAVMESISPENKSAAQNYPKAKEKLIGVIDVAKDLKQRSETRKEEIKNEIQTAINEVKSLLTANNGLITEASKNKANLKTLETTKTELKNIEGAVNETNALADKGEYVAALDKAKVSKEKASSINKQLQESLGKNKNVKSKKG